MSRALVIASIAAASLALGAPRDAHAQQAPAAAPDGNRAVALAQEGRAAYDAGRWDEAHDRFAAAHAAAASPVFELYMARARRNGGKLVEARGIYTRVTRATIAPDAPAAWQQARVDAEAELSALMTQIPSLVVEVAGAPPGTRVRIDARPVRIGETVEVNPGEHRIVATGDGREVSTEITVQAGQRGVRVPVAWDGDARPAAGPSGTSPTSPPDEEGAVGSVGSIVPGVITLAVGGAALGAGALFGALALGEDSDVTSACPGGACRPDVDLAATQDAQSSAGTFADVSTVLFIAGGVLATAGVVLIAVRPGGDDGPETTAAVTPGGLVVRGGF